MRICMGGCIIRYFPAHLHPVLVAAHDRAAAVELALEGLEEPRRGPLQRENGARLSLGHPLFHTRYTTLCGAVCVVQLLHYRRH